MTLVVRDSAKGVTIRATGQDAARLRKHLALALAPECAENGLEPLPNAPKGNAAGIARPLALRIATAQRAGRVW